MSIKGCPQPDPPELVMRADGYHYQEDEMKESQMIQAFDKWAREEAINSFHLGHCWDAWQAALALNAPADRDVMRQTLESIASADIRGWDEEYRDDASFKAWAQSRARHALAAAPTPPAEQPAKVETTYARQHAAHEAELTALIQERDHREEIIDNLCDAVLGPDRAEWSSNYYFEDAVSEVQERITELETRKECRESNAAAEQGEQEPAPDVLATLRAKVEGWDDTIEYQDDTWVPLEGVLFLIDKMGGKA